MLFVKQLRQSGECSRFRALIAKFLRLKQCERLVTSLKTHWRCNTERTYSIQFPPITYSYSGDIASIWSAIYRNWEKKLIYIYSSRLLQFPDFQTHIIKSAETQKSACEFSESSFQNYQIWLPVSPVRQRSLQWLPIDQRINFKICLLLYRAQLYNEPSCLKERLIPRPASNSTRYSTGLSFVAPLTRSVSDSSCVSQCVAQALEFISINTSHRGITSTLSQRQVNAMVAIDRYPKD